MIEAGEIKPIIDKIYSMEQVAEAHHRVETEQRPGIIVIAVAPVPTHTHK
jgi:NADPH:quinone reductase-like Zn-dependent oxidoreductase